MKIALVSPYDYCYPGGVNNHIMHLLNTFRHSAHEAQVIATVPPGHPTPPYTIPLKGRLITLNSGGSAARINGSFAIVRQIRNLLQTEQFDIVHLHNPLAPLVNPAFLINRNVAPQTAFVATFHEYRSTPNQAIELGKPIFRRWLNGLDGRIVVSQAALEFNKPLFPGEYHIIPNGVDVARFQDGQNHFSDKPLTILFVGRLEYRKGFPYLLEAYKRVKMQMPQVGLQVVGPASSDQLEEIKGGLTQAELKDIEFIGRVSDEDLPKYYQAADIFCAPSVDFESFGIVLLEAMAAGTPVVASDIPGYRSVIKPGENGLLAEPKNPLALADILLGLLQNPTQRDQLVQAGFRHVQSFDWKLVGDQVLDFYSQILCRKNQANLAQAMGHWAID